MRRITSFGLVLVLAAGLVGVYAASSSADDEETLKVIEKITAFHPIDNAPSGDSPGDFAVINGDLYKNKGGKAGSKIGTSVVTCHVMQIDDPDVFLVKCLATWSFEDGTLELAAVINEHAPSPHTFDIAILGGTGDFKRARGAGTAKEASEQEILVTLKIASS